eukprot:gene44509-59395_t
MRSSTTEIVNLYSTNFEQGLGSSEVASRRRIHGPNKLEADEKQNIFLKFLEKFKDPLILMLFGSALLSIIVGQYEDAISIAAAVFIVASVGFIQEYQSEKTLEALNNLVPPR